MKKYYHDDVVMHFVGEGCSEGTSGIQAQGGEEGDHHQDQRLPFQMGYRATPCCFVFHHSTAVTLSLMRHSLCDWKGVETMTTK